ncbi:MAG: hypothetical protein KatS3mg057_0255 [Herpetosiphonaceae bacterium]|nr:MAG: hypothetical protein KatS3mg057_0255 [Herpetosiphonaceae bacterium]
MNGFFQSHGTIHTLIAQRREQRGLGGCPPPPILPVGEGVYGDIAMVLVF